MDIQHKPSTNNQVSDNSRLYVLEVQNIVSKRDKYYYEVNFDDLPSYIEMLPYEVDMYLSKRAKKEIVCYYKGINSDGKPILVQDIATQVGELYEEDTICSFTYNNTNTNYNAEGQEIIIHYFTDDFGLFHPYIGILPSNIERGTKVEFYIKGFHTNGLLHLALSNPEFDKPKEWFDPDRLFKEIGCASHKEEVFNVVFDAPVIYNSSLDTTLRKQCAEMNNLWVITYLNIIAKELIPKYTKEDMLNKLPIVGNVLKRIQDWLLTSDSYLDQFSPEKRDKIVLKTNTQKEKYERLLRAVDVIKKENIEEYIRSNMSAISIFAEMALNLEDKLFEIVDIVKIYPSYFLDNADGMRLLLEYVLFLVNNKGIPDESSSRCYKGIVRFIDKEIDSLAKPNRVDASQVVDIYDVLSLLIAKTILVSSSRFRDEMIIRRTKAQFYRHLSLIVRDDDKKDIVSAGINSLVGLLKDEHIFTWDNATHINPVLLCELTKELIALDRCVDNDYCFYDKSGKSGALLLKPTGFIAILNSHCLGSFSPYSPMVSEIKPIHCLKGFPLSLGSMYDLMGFSFGDGPIDNYLLWRKFIKGDGCLYNQKPLEIGDKVRVSVNKQTQDEKLKNLLFVKVIDPSYFPVTGVIPVGEMSNKRIDDVRTIFNEGDSFLAKVCGVGVNKNRFTIKKEVQDISKLESSVEDDLRNIVDCHPFDESNLICKDFVEELVLQIDMLLQIEESSNKRIELLSFLYCLCSIIKDSKSVYYDYLLRYIALKEQFFTNSLHGSHINFPKDATTEFPELKTKKAIVDALMLVAKETPNNEEISQESTSENDLAFSELRAAVKSYQYAKLSNFSDVTISAILEEIQDDIKLIEHREIDFQEVEYINDEPMESEAKTEEDESQQSQYGETECYIIMIDKNYAITSYKITDSNNVENELYKISNEKVEYRFVGFKDSALCFLIETKEDKYLMVRNIKEIISRDLFEAFPANNSEYIRVQPFIMPSDFAIKAGLVEEELIDIRQVPDENRTLLQSYGIYI